MDHALTFERGGKVYLVGPVAPIKPKQADLEEYAFAEVVREDAPNELLLWLQGQYVEADTPNANGQIWTGEELAIKSISPRLMPISVMHDPTRTVGLIADTKLYTPQADKVPRSRIDTALAVWAHRHPDVAEEAMHNYEHGTLQQSMECLPGFYECAECGKSFAKLPHGAERANWCSHLEEGAINSSDSKTRAPRRLGAVTFTGTGLIFGSRGAKGAFDKAHLQTFEEEVAEFHHRATTDKPTRRTRRMETIEIPRSEYDELKKQASQVADLTSRAQGLEEQASKVAPLEKSVEELEVGKKKAEDDLAGERKEREKLEETARAQTLSGDRLGKLGGGFKSKLPDTIKSRLEEQAKVMSDEDWTSRLEELAELTGVKPDEAGESTESGEKAGETFKREETAQTHVGSGSNGSGEPSRQAVSTVLGGLFEQNRPKQQKPEPAKS